MQGIYFKLLFAGFLFSSSLYAQQWKQVGDFNAPPRSFFTDTVDNLFYVGGNFKWSGMDTVFGICTWDGNIIKALGDILAQNCGNVCPPIISIIRYKNEIYVAPDGSHFGGVYTNGIAKWNGSVWSALGGGLQLDSPNFSDGAQVYGLGVIDDKLYCVGGFRTIDGDTCNSVAYWDSIQWHGIGFPNDILYDVPINYKVIRYKNEIYVGGNCNNQIGGVNNDDIARFNGINWEQVGGGLKGGLSDISDMVIYKNELYVCGYFRKSDGNIGNKIMRWDGFNWNDVGGGLCSPNDIATAMLVYEDKLYLVGIFDCVGNGLPASNIAVWDGEHWCSFGNSYFNNKIGSIGVYKNEIYVGGGFTKTDGYPVKYFAKWIGEHNTDTCTETVGVSPNFSTEAVLTLSPVPATELLQINWTYGENTPINWRIFDYCGHDVTLSVSTLSSYANHLNLRIDRLKTGIYCFNVRFKNGQSKSERFVKL
jgi:hypothetical protein